MEISGDEIIRQLLEFSEEIGAIGLYRAAYNPQDWARPTECFSNALSMVESSRGSVLYGWMFHFRKSDRLSNGSYLIAVNHAVWNAPDRKIIDVTPLHEEQAHHPIIIDGSILFLVDENATPLTNGRSGIALPSWFIPVDKEQEILIYLEELTREELRNWETEVTRIGGHPRAATILTMRRSLIGGAPV
jgi:hypothetical protein